MVFPAPSPYLPRQYQPEDKVKGTTRNYHPNFMEVTLSTRGEGKASKE